MTCLCKQNWQAVCSQSNVCYILGAQHTIDEECLDISQSCCKRQTLQIMRAPQHVMWGNTQEERLPTAIPI